MELRIDIESLSLDDMLETAELFVGLDTEEVKAMNNIEAIQKIKPVLAHFLFDDDGEKIADQDKAREFVGKMKLTEIMPKIPKLMDELSKLTELMSFPPVSSGGSH